MRRETVLFACLFLLSALTAERAQAEIGMSVPMTLKLEETPLDTEVSAGGRYIFVLTDKGTVLVYTPDGKLSDTLEVGSAVDSIKAGPREEVLLLVSSKERTVRVAVLDFVQEINTAGSPFKGKAEAPVTIVLFTDFQCPYCARAVPLLEQVLEKNKDKVKLVFKNFPLKSHAFARKAAAAALAAAEQGKFWEYHDRLFQNYSRLNDQVVQELAQQIGLDLQRFEKDMDDPQVSQAISQDLQDGAKAGVRGTPTFFVNGSLLRNTSLEGFQAAIDKELEKLGKK